jgi:hypothetical protein
VPTARRPTRQGAAATLDTDPTRQRTAAMPIQVNTDQNVADLEMKGAARPTLNWLKERR